MSSDYDKCAKSALKLKINPDMKKKKKKNKNKERDQKILENISKPSHVQNNSDKPESTLTKAELSFLKQQEKVQKKRILEKASMTHRQRVEVFNKHLDSLTEHFDIPKVSWTK